MSVAVGTERQPYPPENGTKLDFLSRVSEVRTACDTPFCKDAAQLDRRHPEFWLGGYPAIHLSTIARVVHHVG